MDDLGYADFKTTDLQTAQEIFARHQSFNRFSRGDNSLNITPHWETFYQIDFEETGEKLSLVDVDLNVTKNQSETELVFFEIDGYEIALIQSTKVNSLNSSGELENGIVSFHKMNGEFVEAYLFEDSYISKRLINTNTSNASMFFFQSSDDCDEDYNPETVYCTNNLEEVTVVKFTYKVAISLIYLYIEPEGLVTPEGDRGGGGDPQACNIGYQMGPDGSCIKTPCYNPNTQALNPLSNMRILGSEKNGIKGGMHGNGRGKNHQGVDFMAEPGTPIYATTSGQVASAPFVDSWEEGEPWTGGEMNRAGQDSNGAGNRFYINTTFNNESYRWGYWHLSEVYVRPGQYVTIGTIIGRTGTTGNGNAKNQFRTSLTFKAR